MISFQEAREVARESAKIIPQIKKEVELSEALGRILAMDIASPLDIPLFNNAAMDGFAIGPIENSSNKYAFKLVGEIPAGKSHQLYLHPGEAVRIYTGSMIPNGTFAVVPVEDIESLQDDQYVVIELTQIRKGQHIRYKGEQFKKGNIVLRKGTFLNEAGISLLSFLGIRKIPINDFPEVILLITGNEIIQKTTKKLKPGEIYDSNGVLLQAYLTKWKIKHKIFFVPDERKAIRTVIENILSQNCIIVSTGGVSVGKYDHVPYIAQSLGFNPIFHKVKQKPGKPLFFAVHEKNGWAWWGLPGNPAAVWMCFNLYVLPFLLYNAGYTREYPPIVEAELTQEIVNPSDRDRLLGARFTNSGKIEIFPKQRSDMLAPLTQSNAIALIPSGSKLSEGEKIKAFLI